MAALRNISYFKFSMGKPEFLLRNRADYYQKPIVFNTEFLRRENIRFYRFSENRNWKISRTVSFSNPIEQPNVSRHKSAVGLPPIDPNKARDVLSEINNESIHKSENMAEMRLEGDSDKIAAVTDTEDASKRHAIQRVYSKIKAELIHYYHGFRLLIFETKVACGILYRVAKGQTLTRRERKQLVRTVADLARMVPFLVFILVPFMELALPIYLKLFPNMMPSTFQESSKEAEKTRKLLKVKLEMAKFLQDTLEETISVTKYSSEANISLESFNRFMKQVRDAGQTASTTDIVKFSRLFEDEVTLESLEHRQLKALCKLLELNSIGPRALLSFHLKLKVHQLKVDDKMIAKEGIDKLPAWELQQLCRERGMRAMGVSEDRLRFQLKQWLKLSIDKQVPISLLLMSRTMYLPEHVSAEQQLTKAIFNLPEAVSKEASLRTASKTEKFDHKTKLELVKEEQEAILEEKEAATKQAESIRIDQETLIDKAPIITAASGVKLGDIESGSGETISTSDLSQIETAIESIENTKNAVQEEELEELKEETEELRQEPVVMVTETGSKLSKRLQYMINDMDTLLDRLRVEKETIMDGIAHGDAAAPAKDEKRVIAITDVMKALKQLKSISGDERKWQRILEVLDEDHDGQIEVHHVTEVLDILGNDEVKLSSKEMERVLQAIDKEEVIEKEIDESKMKM